MKITIITNDENKEKISESEFIIPEKEISLSELLSSLDGKKFDKGNSKLFPKIIQKITNDVDIVQLEESINAKIFLYNGFFAIGTSTFSGKILNLSNVHDKLIARQMIAIFLLMIKSNEISDLICKHIGILFYFHFKKPKDEKNLKHRHLLSIYRGEKTAKWENFFEW